MNHFTSTSFYQKPGVELTLPSLSADVRAGLQIGNGSGDFLVMVAVHSGVINILPAQGLP